MQADLVTQSGAMAAAQGAKVWQSCAALMRKFQEECGSSYRKCLCYVVPFVLFSKQEASRSSLMERVFSRLCSHIMMYMIRLMHSSGFAVVVGGWVNKQYI